LAAGSDDEALENLTGEIALRARPRTTGPFAIGGSGQLEFRPLLALEQGPLAFEAPAVASDRAALLDHAMAGNDNGHRVRGAGSGDCASLHRNAKTPRDVAIGCSLPGRNF